MRWPVNVMRVRKKEFEIENSSNFKLLLPCSSFLYSNKETLRKNSHGFVRNKNIYKKNMITFSWKNKQVKVEKAIII